MSDGVHNHRGLCARREQGLIIGAEGVRDIAFYIDRTNYLSEMIDNWLYEFSTGAANRRQVSRVLRHVLHNHCAFRCDGSAIQTLSQGECWIGGRLGAVPRDDRNLRRQDIVKPPNGNDLSLE